MKSWNYACPAEKKLNKQPITNAYNPDLGPVNKGLH